MVAHMFANTYKGKRVFITGHTGFKGSWLSEWLLMLGAEVTGYSIRVNEGPDHFTDLGLEGRIRHVIGDVRDLPLLKKVVGEARPDFIFHLAAQPLVRLSYQEPVETMTTNITGTLHVLDVLRGLAHRCACIIVTSDKCYENREVLHGYRENDRLGGRDPYSASKGAAELLVHSYRSSFFDGPESKVTVATARAGNVIGGGDWAADRIVPDCARSLARGEAIAIRNPAATRPWQHVLEPLSGYLWLGALLTGEIGLPGGRERSAVSGPFNFGPWPEANRSVRELVTEFLKHWPGQWSEAGGANVVHESGLLSLAIDKAFHVLNWQPVWSFARNVKATAGWYRAVALGATVTERTRGDINAYMSDARDAGIAWALDSLLRAAPREHDSRRNHHSTAADSR
ncbi:MAG: CDP-glucose 4,6-dehydratase [Betaproteobacteria bacterium]|nr:CDP-glucose 4,6-dehydratase [Betaproteobacteria bacterium]